MSVSFREILNQKCWDNYETYIAEGIQQYSKELSADITQGRKHKAEIRKLVEDKYEIKKVPDDLSAELKLLITGEVVGIDGTIATHKTITGIMAQLGVVAVNYLNDKIQHSYFISEARYKQNIDDIADYLYSHEPANKEIERIRFLPIRLFFAMCCAKQNRTVKSAGKQ